MRWKKALGIVVLSSLMYLPYLFFDFVFQNFYHYVFVAVSLQILLLFPIVVFSMSGFRWGALSGFVFAAAQLVANLASQTPSEPAFSLFLFFSLLVYPITTGIASHKLSDKRAFWFYLGLSIVILIAFRWYFG